MIKQKMSKKNIAVIGASGHGHVVADCVQSNKNLIFKGFFDDDTTKKSLGLVANCEKYPEFSFVFGIGNNETRKKIASLLHVEWQSVIHPSAIISPSAEIGEGTVVMPGAIINARAKIGKHCIINTGAIIEHDNVIEDYVHISVGAKLGGTVHVGQSTTIGIGAVVKNNISICAGSVVGAGAVVVHDIVEEGIYIGVPAKNIKKK